MDDEDPQVIINAIWALKNIGASKGLKEIVEFVTHRNSKIAEAAQAALKAAANQDFGEDKARWLKWVEENARQKP